MKNETDYKKIFIDRLSELEVYPDQYTITPVENKPYKFIVRVNEPKDKTGLVRLHIISHLILGLIYHFNCRKWITGHSYTYIMKSYHSITFNDGNTETE